ncbi:MAG: hypothetical protein ACPKOI_12370 [Pleomorphochaeta sp.]|jgi:hypothetical protein
MKNLKKITVTLFVLISTLIMFSACSTTVTVSYLKPAKYDLTQYKNLAIASMGVETVPPFSGKMVTVRYDDFEDVLFSGYSRRIASNVAEDFTDNLYIDLYKTSYFNIIKPAITDVYIDSLKFGVNSLDKLRNLGIQALLVSQIDAFNYQEYPIVGDYKLIVNPAYATDPTQPQYIESTEREVTIMQQAIVSYSYRVVDINTGEILASNSFSQTIDNEVDYKDNLVNLPSMENLYKRALLIGEKQIVKDLSPQFISTHITLKKNKSGNPYFDAGMNAVNQGALKVAYDNFNKAWNSADMFEAGYNSALLLEALGNRDAAIARMKEVYNYYSNVDAYNQITRMEKYRYSDDVAQNQINN